ncbi:hypothetical protein DFH06DRAFT_1330561 [Mycena polygramma]|nr:hypothetical protein DFH06DRAFT_1330561 [Mycena polygramma]
MSSAHTGAYAIPNISAIASPMLIGSLLNFLFFGTLLVQTYTYRICFPRDSFAVKLLVYSTLLAMSVCTCLNGADVESWYGASCGQIQGFKNLHFLNIYSPVMGSLIAAAVQLFFCYRIIVIKRAAWPLCSPS